MKLPNMTANFTAWFQTLSMLLQWANHQALSEPWKTRVLMVLGLVQAVQAIMAHWSAPNGQSLQAGNVPYVPPPAPPPAPGPPAAHP